MFTKNTPSGMNSDKSCRRNGARDLGSILLLTLLLTTAVACHSPLAASTEQWIPPYLQLRLSAGKAQVQWLGDSEWQPLKDGTIISIEEAGQIIADAVEGARFSVGNGSTLKLDPGTILELQNPRTSPRLQMALKDGALVFAAQAPSYELIVPACSVSLLSIPSQIEIEVDGETSRVAVKEGAVICTMEEEVVTLSTCQQAHISAGEEPEITEFCPSDTATPLVAPSLAQSPTASSIEPTATSLSSPTATPLSSPTATPRFTPTATPRFTPTATLTSTLSPTPTATSTPSPTPTPTSADVVLTLIPTYTPVPPTNTPPPPPTKKPRRDPTNTPQSPPTNTPKPPPTEPPPPPPTEPPPPPPTEVPRPTPTSPPSAAPSNS